MHRKTTINMPFGRKASEPMGPGPRRRGAGRLNADHLPRHAERSEAGGSSNTPLSSYEKWKYGTCIDYFKYRFDFGEKEIPQVLPMLFKILGVHLADSAKKPGRNNYSTTVVLADEIFLYYGGTSTVTKEGYETCLLEMKGKGCREFEERAWTRAKRKTPDRERQEVLNKAWSKLIEECKRLGGTCTRIDLTTDDFSGNITMDEVRSKIQKREFSAKVRRVEMTSNEIAQKQDDSPYLGDFMNVYDSSRAGYTATLGTRERLQLCIYDKSAEQASKGNEFIPENWIRYEVRFYKDAAEKEIPRLQKALQEGKESAHIVGCLVSIFEFKEENTLGKSNVSKAPTWEKWKTFIKEAEIPEAFSNTPWTMTIETNAKFLMTSCSGSFLRVLAAGGSTINEMATLMILHELDLMEEDDLEIINQFRRSKKLREFPNLQTFKMAMMTRDDLADEFGPLVTELMKPDVGKKKHQKEDSDG